MATRKSTKQEDVYDCYCCSVDGWQRDFSFGIRRFQIPGMETDDPVREMDRIVVTGTVQNHDTNRKPKGRSYRHVELWIFPSHVPREQWRKDLDAVGHTWTERGKPGIPHGSVKAPADVYYSLLPCLAINHFREFTVKVLNLRYSKGSIDEYSFDTLKESIKFSE